MKRLKIAIPIILMFFFINVKCYSWFDAGHMIIAKIAYENLDESVRAKADSLIKLLGDVDPEYTDFVQSATWMDGVKSTGIPFFNDYHFIDQYYVVYPIEETLQVTEQNVVWTVENAISTFKDERSSDYAKALSLRFLIHMVGDCHQPLHATSRVTEENQEGDRGGNSFKVDPIPYGTYLGEPSYLSNLHKVWDSGVLAFTNINAADYPTMQDSITNDITKIDTYITSLSPKKQKEIKDKISNNNTDEWAIESYNFAMKYVYTGIEENGKLTDDYKKQGSDVCMEQAYVAGMRLANLLNELLK